MKEIEKGDKVFYKTFWGNVFGVANHVGEKFIFIDDILWYESDNMMKYCKKIEKERVKLV